MSLQGWIHLAKGDHIKSKCKHTKNRYKNKCFIVEIFKVKPSLTHVCGFHNFFFPNVVLPHWNTFLHITNNHRNWNLFCDIKKWENFVVFCFLISDQKITWAHGLFCHWQAIRKCIVNAKFEIRWNCAKHSSID